MNRINGHEVDGIGNLPMAPPHDVQDGFSRSVALFLFLAAIVCLGVVVAAGCLLGALIGGIL